jgi:Holliday junction resolvase-like predicted endonuclease
MRAAGDVFELRACTELERAGLKLLARNYTTRYGELDLVMSDDDTVVFVEVRCRKKRQPRRRRHLDHRQQTDQADPVRTALAG